MENEVKVEWSKENTGFWQATIKPSKDVVGIFGNKTIYLPSSVSAEVLPTLIELLTLARDGEFAPPEPEHIRLLRKAKEILKDIPYLPRRENEINCDLRKEIEAYLEKEKMNEE